jgi:hydrogenase maturation protease
VPEHARGDGASSSECAAVVVVIGIGNEMRGDDAAGLHAARRLRALVTGERVRVLEHEGETLGLLERLRGARAAVLVDAIRSGAPAGTIHRLDAAAGPIPQSLRGSSSTHAVGLAEALELARALGELPEQVLLYGIEGRSFEAGIGLSGEVLAALPALVDELRAGVERLAA